MPLEIKSKSELKNTLGKKTFAIGRETRKEMIKVLYKSAKTGFGWDSDVRRIHVGKVGSDKYVDFEMKNLGGEMLDNSDLERLGKQLFGSRSGSGEIIAKTALADNLAKSIKGLSKVEAKRLIETLLNEVHGHDAHQKIERKKAGEILAERQERRKQAESRESKFGPRGEVIEKGERWGETPSHSDPFVPNERGGLPSRGETGASASASHTVFRDLHLHLH